jgi:hypothetical protein
MPAIDDRDATDLGRRFFEQMIGQLRPDSKFSWHEETERELHTVSISEPGMRSRLEITQEALDQAADDPSSHDRLAREVRVQLRVSESRECVGRVTEA